MLINDKVKKADRLRRGAEDGGVGDGEVSAVREVRRAIEYRRDVRNTHETSCLEQTTRSD